MTNHTEVQVVAREHSVQGAIKAIHEKRPDLVFMDLELEGGSGFDVLRAVLPWDSYLIFTTALDEQDLSQIGICGLQSLPKPIDYLSLSEALQVAAQRRNSAFYQKILHNFLQTIQYNIPSPYLYYADGPNEEYLLIADIIGIEDADPGTYLVLKSGDKKWSTSSLKAYELQLSAYPFFRVHKDHLINTREMLELILEAPLSVIMKNGYHFPLSAKKQAALTTLFLYPDSQLGTD